MIYGFMRIKDEARWIARVLAAMQPVCDQIFILDDHSTDGTREICQKFDKVRLFQSPFEGVREDRDKNFLLERLEQVASPGDWVLSIDGDEEIAPGGCDIIRDITSSGYPYDAYRFQVLYLWNSPDQIRVDRWYSNFSRTSLFRLRAGARFVSSSGAGFHCGNAPEVRNLSNCNVKLLHYGYMHREDRVRKWHFYNEHDPRNCNEGYDPSFPERMTYPHIVQGDIPEVPADAVLMYAGPLELKPL
jgi:glycosyltransferase involved in cell wall biosynthesis